MMAGGSAHVIADAWPEEVEEASIAGGLSFSVSLFLLLVAT